MAIQLHLCIKPLNTAVLNATYRKKYLSKVNVHLKAVFNYTGFQLTRLDQDFPMGPG